MTSRRDFQKQGKTPTGGPSTFLFTELTRDGTFLKVRDFNFTSLSEAV